MSRAMFVNGYTSVPPTGDVERDETGEMTWDHPAVKDVDEPDAVGAVMIDLSKLDPSIRFLRVMCR